MNRIDLHIHTNNSDGSFSSKEIVKMAEKARMNVIAITDHNTVSGIDEALQSVKGNLNIVPGIEFTITDFLGKTHLLCYGFDYNNDELQVLLRRYSLTKFKYMMKLLSNLTDSGITISKEAIEKRYQHLSYKNIAEELLRLGYGKNLTEIYTQYIEPHLQSLRRIGFTINQVIPLIHKLGGITVLAHPYTLGIESAAFEQAISQLCDLGLDGLECYYSEYTFRQRSELAVVAEKYHLVKSVGSDFHGALSVGVEMGIGRGDLALPNQEDASWVNALNGARQNE